MYIQVRMNNFSDTVNCSSTDFHDKRFGVEILLHQILILIILILFKGF